jgi:hypothetical protein
MDSTLFKKLKLSTFKGDSKNNGQTLNDPFSLSTTVNSNNSGTLNLDFGDGLRIEPNLGEVLIVSIDHIVCIPIQGGEPLEDVSLGNKSPSLKESSENLPREENIYATGS